MTAIPAQTAPGGALPVNLETVDVETVGVKTAGVDQRTARVRPRARSGVRETMRRRSLAVQLAVTDAAAVMVVAAVTGPPLGWAVLTAVVLLCTSASMRLYRHRLWLSFGRELPRALGAAALALGVLATLATTVRAGNVVVVSVIQCGLLSVALAAPCRLVMFNIARRNRRRRGPSERTIVVAVKTLEDDFVATMRENPEFNLDPVELIDGALPVSLLGPRLAEAIHEHRASTVVLAFANARDPQIADIAVMAHQLGAKVLTVPRMFELYQDGIDVERLRSYPLVQMATPPMARPSWRVKRAGDILLAALSLLVLSPVLVAAALAVLYEDGRPVFFRQQRIGLGGNAFELRKLRSMRAVTDLESATQWSVVGDPRVGPVGRFLRRTSIDELPQLWNVVRGDMSLVGPRPERPDFARDFTARYPRYWARHRVPVGITGLAQVNGLRGDTSIPDRARFDNYYIANWSLWLDVQILCRTVREVFRCGNH